mmetsp:Transcript_34354/g.60359  ORF Transcript_34354/g.60359 Transcript_34354/m.60359 type:complete len:125 (+) Transcript_34354:474-848(+)
MPPNPCHPKCDQPPLAAPSRLYWIRFTRKNDFHQQHIHPPPVKTAASASVESDSPKIDQPQQLPTAQAASDATTGHPSKYAYASACWTPSEAPRASSPSPTSSPFPPRCAAADSAKPPPLNPRP